MDGKLFNSNSQYNYVDVCLNKYIWKLASKLVQAALVYNDKIEMN